MRNLQQSKTQGTISLLLAVAFASGVLSSCSSSAPSSKASDSAGTPAATPVTPTTPVTAADVLAQGHDLYTMHCGTCHALPDPAAHPAAKWPHLVDWMHQRANLDTAEASKVLAWVLAERARLTAK